MRHLELKPTTRPVTTVLFNRESDLLFTSGKDGLVTVWRTEDGTRLGTYKHESSVNAVDVDPWTQFLITCDADGAVKIWDIQTGVERAQWNMNQPAMACGWSEDATSFFVLTMKFSTNPSRLIVYNFNRATPEESERTPILSTVLPQKPVAGFFGPFSKEVVVVFEEGSARKYSIETGDMIVENALPHKSRVVKCSSSPDRNSFLTASRDQVACLVDTKSLQVIRIYSADKPLNTAVMAPLKDHILLGGGQDSRDVATKRADEATFDIMLVHKVYGDDIGSVRAGHIGPVNSLAFSPDGTMFASGGEEGVVMLFKLDPEYFQLD